MTKHGHILISHAICVELHGKPTCHLFDNSCQVDTRCSFEEAPCLSMISPNLGIKKSTRQYRLLTIKRFVRGGEELSPPYKNGHNHRNITQIQKRPAAETFNRSFSGYSHWSHYGLRTSVLEPIEWGGRKEALHAAPHRVIKPGIEWGAAWHSTYEEKENLQSILTSRRSSS